MKNHAPRGEKNYHVNPHLKVYGPQTASPQALEREISTQAQTYEPEHILLWGPDNALPLRILQAINQSPTTLSCLSTTESYIKGAGFTDPGLESLVIDKDGTTLWELHCQLAAYLTVLDGFSVNFKYNDNSKITNSYVLGLESNRFVAPGEKSKKIEFIKYNPYYGTDQYRMEYTQEFNVYDLDKVKEQIKANAKKKDAPLYKGQIYFCGSVRPPYKFYPVPKYWSGEEWIYVDSQIKVFHKAALDNGFFQSVLMNVIGKPDDWSKDPSQMKEVLDETTGQKRKVATKTNAQMFDEMMSATFSGARKANSAFVVWSGSPEAAVKLSAFPTNSNFDVLSGTFTDTIRGITIATDVPAILANLPMSENSLGSDGKSMQTAVEITQSRTYPKRIKLEQFYNKILLPNLEAKGTNGKKVEIKNYSPITKAFSVPKEVWEFLNEAEKISYIEKAMPEIKMIRTASPAVAPQVGEDGQPLPAAPPPNEALKKLNMTEVARATKITKRFILGELTYDQAKQILLGYGFTESDIPAWLPQQNGVEV